MKERVQGKPQYQALVNGAYPRVEENRNPQESDRGAKCCTGLPYVHCENYFDLTNKKQNAEILCGTFCRCWSRYWSILCVLFTQKTLCSPIKIISEPISMFQKDEI